MGWADRRERKNIIKHRKTVAVTWKKVSRNEAKI